MADFSQLIQTAENILQDIEGFSEYPKAKLSLHQILEGINDLYTRVAQTGAQDIQANLLLGSKGIDLPRLNQQLESICTKRLFESIQPVAVKDLDISNLLESEIRNKILGVFESGYSQMLTFTHMSRDHQQLEWKQEKRKILNAMSTSSGAALEVGKHSNTTLDRISFAPEHLGPFESLYIQKIIEYNKSIKKPNLVNIFSSIVSNFKDPQVTYMWEIMEYMVQLPSFPLSADPIKIRNSKPVITALVKQAKKYLEDRYKIFMKEVTGDLLHAGITDTYRLAHSFVGLVLQREYFVLQDVLIDDRPLWPMVYYCIRCGDLPQAIYCLKKSNLPELQDMISLLEAKFSGISNKETAKLEEVMKFSYRRVVRNDTDPFKRIVWSVLGYCDIKDDHSEVARTADDYLWLKLNFVRLDAGKDNSIDYKNLQKIILEDYGETHYDAFNQPNIYFQMLCLTGQFEAAVEFLSRTKDFMIHGIHMAIALNELHILGLPKDIGSPLLSIDPMDDKPSCRLNFARFIILYVKKFETIWLNETLHYYYFLHHYSDSEGKNLFKVCVSSLAEETKKYETILGKVQANGVRTKGLVDQFSDINVTSEDIAQLIGKNLLQKGLFEEAIDLFDISQNQDQVLKLICGILSRTGHLANKSDPFLIKFQTKADHYGERLLRTDKTVSSHMVHSFLKLKDLLTFFVQYHSKKYNEALRTLDDIELVPLRLYDIEDRIKNFKNLHQDVCKVIPHVLLATMNILHAQYQKIQAHSEYIPRFKNEMRSTELRKLREQAKCLTNFTDQLPYRMPGDMNSRLLQTELLMN